MTWDGLNPPYATIVADPPWPITWNAEKGHSPKRGNKRALSYTPMPVDRLAALPVGSLAAENAHLYLWATSRFFRDGTAYRVAQAWGFNPRAEIIWRKPGIGLGTFPRLAHEYLLIAARGHLPFAGPRDVASVQDWPYLYAKGRVHSAKPAAALDLIAQQSPGPYLELFARAQRLGWDSWGWGYEHAG